MNIQDIVYKQLNGQPYDFFRRDTGEFVTRWRENTETFIGRTLYLLWANNQTDTTSQMTVTEIRPDISGKRWLCPLSDRSLRRDSADSPWILTGQADYFSDATGDGVPYLPADIVEGDILTIQNAGRWTWHDDQGHSGDGAFTYIVDYSMLLGRLTVDEKWDEWHADTQRYEHFHRLEAFDATLGRLGFKDRLVTGWDGVVGRKEGIVAVL